MSECTLGQSSFDHISWPDPIVGYMVGSVFVPRYLSEKLMAEHPVPESLKLIPVRQAPIDGAAFTFPEVLAREVEADAHRD